MADITAAMVKELRERTGAGMMECKKALSAAEGDMEKAVDYLWRDLRPLPFQGQEIWLYGLQMITALSHKLLDHVFVKRVIH